MLTNKNREDFFSLLILLITVVRKLLIIIQIKKQIVLLNNLIYVVYQKVNIIRLFNNKEKLKSKKMLSTNTNLGKLDFQNLVTL